MSILSGLKKNWKEILKAIITKKFKFTWKF